jgi:phage pi2 protein 07
LKLYNQELDTLCGIPLKILIKPNLISVVGMDSGLLAYYPMNTENKREAFSVLTTSKLRFHFDDMLDFIDVNPYRSLLDKEKEVLSNI